MMELRPDEQLLTGQWLGQEGAIKSDPVCQRIEWLLTHRLSRIADSPQWGSWETLFLDQNDGRYWERTYPKGGMHGGGPPQLKLLTADDAKRKYGLA